MFRADGPGGDGVRRLNPGEAAIVFALPGETTEDEAAILRARLLSEDEWAGVARQAGFQQHDRVIARALVRLGLSRHFPVAPAEWRFQRDAHDRPFVFAPAGLPPFQFSLSHTRGLIALLVTTAPQGGVDVEQMERTNDLALVATKICAASELESLNRLSGDGWKERFFELWTLKEAYAKARGLGLSLPWDGIAFETGAEVKVRFSVAIDDDPARWQFSLHRVTPLHMMATAICDGDGKEIRLEKVRVRASNDRVWLEC